LFDSAIEVINLIEKKGFKAYIVGGYVRDHLLGFESSDIDICTNAKVKDIIKIFDDVSITPAEYGSVKIVTNTLRIDITTYRRDLKYNGSRRKVEVEYVDNLLDDVNRRDFTMNTLCMNKDGNIIDVLNGAEDIKNKIIKCVGNVEDRINEDPLRMLRAVRFAAVLGFKIEDSLYKALKNNKELINQLSRERIKAEIDKILVCPNALYGLQLLKDLDYLDLIGISYGDIVYVSDICGMYSQLKLTKTFPFSKEERKNIEDIKKVLKHGDVDNIMMYKYGLYVSMVAGEILGIDKEIISKMYKKLPISDKKDLDITSSEICDILNIEPCKVISLVQDKIINLILRNVLKNDNLIIRNYISLNREKWLDEGADV
jgi:tRNA nucleotidyltransferase (CCA-adding enzyme)